MWVDRVPRFIESQGGIDRWPGRQTVSVTTLVDARMMISDILEGKTIAGRNVEIYMKGEHMATLRYGPTRGFRRRKLVRTTYHV